MSLIKDGKVYRTIEEQVAWLTKTKFNSYQKQEVNEMVETLNQKINTKAEKQEVNQTVETLNQKINTKQDKLNFDTIPTKNSTNPVTSGGVYNAIETEKQELNESIENLEQKYNSIETKINTTSTSPITLANNTSFRLGTITTLTINNATSYPLDFMCEIVFMAGVPISIDYSALTITFTGDDCDNNVFVPQVNKTYNILFFNNSSNSSAASLQAIVRGV